MSAQPPPTPDEELVACYGQRISGNLTVTSSPTSKSHHLYRNFKVPGELILMNKYYWVCAIRYLKDPNLAPNITKHQIGKDFFVLDSDKKYPEPLHLSKRTQENKLKQSQPDNGREEKA